MMERSSLTVTASITIHFMSHYDTNMFGHYSWSAVLRWLPLTQSVGEVFILQDVLFLLALECDGV